MATALSQPRAGRTAITVPRPNPYFGSGLLAVSDALALLTAGALGGSAWLMWTTGAVDWSAAILVPVAVSMIAYAGQGLYSAVGLTGAEQLRRIVLTTTLVYLALTAALFLTKEGAGQSRGVVFCSWALSVFLVPALRAFVVHRFCRMSWWGAPVVIVGRGDLAHRLMDLFRARPQLGLKPVAVVDGTRNAPEQAFGLPVYSSIHELPLPVSHAIVVDSALRAQPLLDACSARFAHVLLVPDLGAATTLWVSPTDLGGTLGLELRHNLLMPLDRCLKRVLDVVVSLVAGLFAIPIIVIAASWIAAASRQSPFFAQRRQSCSGKEVTVYKLRTMYPDADMMLLQYLARSDDARAEWDRYYKLKKDPRVLPGIGHFLRRTSLDELPQFWNILRGDMSVVGPRPVMAEEVIRYGSSFDVVGRVKPGLTGLWQVSGRNDLSYDERIRLDSYYVRNWSIWLDLTIIAQTLRVVVSRCGAY